MGLVRVGGREVRKVSRPQLQEILGTKNTLILKSCERIQRTKISPARGQTTSLTSRPPKTGCLAPHIPWLTLPRHLLRRVNVTLRWLRVSGLSTVLLSA